ncbi:Biosynthetic arginine decarboxylase [uncultured Desulfobacterium sp.]|uniref:Biosynthetic arginine decarboxylase n=1 Tax=uncultured Desulfobacterium sp. TaxID=201089 RepID=A0A445MW31_9BACT|nr:Biosynthetic arginine decarboxylase [uncultured Desulfobacterium sp.]
MNQLMKGIGSLERWTIENSADLYGIRNWGSGYFNISDKGEVVINPTGKDSSSVISLMDVISGIKERGLGMPILLRVGDILQSRISLLHNSFQTAIDTFGYKGQYRGVFPIKVNQQQQVVEEVTHFGSKYHHGLEAGSKAELIAAISLLKDPEACLICNGYKDEEFIDLGLYTQKMGFKCFFVIEMPSELPLIIERAARLNIKPLLGIRIKLATRAGGHWTESGGDRSIFGLSTTQLIQMVDYLKEKGMIDCLQLLHYHLGSQIPNIRDIRSAVVEACRVYAGLVDEGAPMGYLDIGGGLAVDYDGSHTNFTSSGNYSLAEYCADVIEVIMGTLDEHDIAHPTIISESGRATVAYYSVLLFNIIDVSCFQTLPLPEKPPEDTHEMILNLLDVLHTLTLKNMQECYNDAIYYRDEIRQLFKHGNITLRERVTGENIFWHVMKKIATDLSKLKNIPSELKGIEHALADIYYGNFSVFQSLPDAWAIDHLFPIMPVHRLNEAPTRNAILADITCDCDGKIDKFIDTHNVRQSLPLHDFKPDEDYYLGVFLVGAYQENLGDLHNLLGDTNIVSIQIQKNGDFKFVQELEGDSVADVLSYVEYDTKAIVVRFRETAEKAVRKGLITPNERQQIMRAYQKGLRGYTYFER